MTVLIWTGLTIVTVIALLAQLGWLGLRGDASAPVLPVPERRRHVWLGAFYVNPSDPRGWVPKLSGLGWTVNFRTKGQAALFAGLLLVVLASALMLTWSAVAQIP